MAPEGRCPPALFLASWRREAPSGCASSTSLTVAPPPVGVQSLPGDRVAHLPPLICEAQRWDPPGRLLRSPAPRAQADLSCRARWPQPVEPRGNPVYSVVQDTHSYTFADTRRPPCFQLNRGGAATCKVSTHS